MSKATPHSPTARFDVSADLEYDIAFPSTFILSMHAQRSRLQTVTSEELVLEPKVKIEELVSDNDENHFVRFHTGKQKTLAIRYRATVERSVDLLSVKDIEATRVAAVDRRVLPYLFPSRYCQSDRLSRFAWDLFGKIGNQYQTVRAIDDWIFANVEYLRGSTDSETSAFDTVTQRTGVCRDFAHLGIALCRALNIPARYFTGYALDLVPPDMHACFEAFLGGRWIIFDPTRLSSLNGLVRIAVGRDAADAAVASIFGRAKGKKFAVDCQLAKGEKFTPFNRKQLASTCVSLEPAAA